MKTLTSLMIGVCVAGLSGPLPGRAAGDEVITTVYSTAFNGYVRTKAPDGSFKPETYAFAQGKYMSGQARDGSIDNFPFLNLARMLAPYLGRQNYLPTSKPEQTDLLIVVHWGTTIPYDQGTYRTAVSGLGSAVTAASTGSVAARPEDITGALMELNMENQVRNQTNARNAALLGYLPEMKRSSDTMRVAGLGSYYDDLVSDVEEDRYFVILAAYDYHAAWKEKHRKLLWMTRVSISTRGNRFDEQLDAMIRSASQYFGQNSPGLIRQGVPEGKVKVGEPKVIGVVPDAGK